MEQDEDNQDRADGEYEDCGDANGSNPQCVPTIVPYTGSKWSSPISRNGGGVEPLSYQGEEDQEDEGQ